MKKSIRNIISIFVVVLIYSTAIYEKLNGTVDLTIQGLFGKYMLYTIVGIILILTLNKYFLKKLFNVFASKDGSILLDIAFGFLFLVISYFISNILRITYDRWFVSNIDRSDLAITLQEILSNPFYIILMLGPFIWFSEIFMVISRAFLLNNLWDLNSNKSWAWISIIVTAIFCSFTQIHNGASGVISSFLIYTVAHILYYKYRRIYPLILAGILLQTIQFAVYWTNNF